MGTKKAQGEKRLRVLSYPKRKEDKVDDYSASDSLPFFTSLHYYDGVSLHNVTMHYIMIHAISMHAVVSGLVQYLNIRIE